MIQFLRRSLRPVVWMKRWSCSCRTKEPGLRNRWRWWRPSRWLLIDTPTTMLSVRWKAGMREYGDILEIWTYPNPTGKYFSWDGMEGWQVGNQRRLKVWNREMGRQRCLKSEKRPECKCNWKGRQTDRRPRRAVFPKCPKRGRIFTPWPIIWDVHLV